MGPGMTSSMTSVRSGSELSDSDMESSTHSLASFTQPASLSAQVQPTYVCVYSLNICQMAVCRATAAVKLKKHQKWKKRKKFYWCPSVLLKVVVVCFYVKFLFLNMGLCASVD